GDSRGNPGVLLAAAGGFQGAEGDSHHPGGATHGDGEDSTAARGGAFFEELVAIRVTSRGRMAVDIPSGRIFRCQHSSSTMCLCRFISGFSIWRSAGN